MKVASNILNNKSDSEECVNDAFFGVWNTIPPQRPDRLPSYVCRIVRNLALKRYHANTAAKRGSVYDVALDELESCFPSSDSVEEEFGANEVARLIDAFLEMLDEDSKAMFVCRYYYSDSVSDIAKLLHMSPHKVSDRLHRIREKLRKYLIEEGVTI